MQNKFQNWLKVLSSKPYASRTFYTPKRLIYIGLSFVGMIILFLSSLVFLVWVEAFDELPDVKDLQNINQNFSSEIFSVDGQVLGRFYKENRSPIDTNSIGPYLMEALVATEDERFFEHKGIDLIALGRVMFKTVLLQDRRGGGGSTISQQLAKNLFPRRKYRFLTIPMIKIREMFIASRLEKAYSKNEILILYLNTVPFSNVYGIKVAAEQFFNKKPEELNIQEAATLIGMLKANTTYNPIQNPDKSRQRRNVVLGQMAKNDALETALLDSIKGLPLTVDFVRQSKSSGVASHFRAFLKRKVSEVLSEESEIGDEAIDLQSDGLKIYTSINYEMQKLAEQAVKKHITQLNRQFRVHWKGRNIWDEKQLWAKIKKTSRYESWTKQGLNKKEIEAKLSDLTIVKDPLGVDEPIPMTIKDSIIYMASVLNAGFIVAENETGAIRTWVGGARYQFSQYDRILSKRPVGSTFKPIVYATAIDQGVDPCRLFPNNLTTYTDYQDWKPENSNGKYGGYYSLGGALKTSLNVVSVQVLLEATTDSVIQMARKIGLVDEIPNVPSIALGTSEHSLLEMLKPYGTLANKGKGFEPYFIERIEDSKGNILFERQAAETEQKMQKSTALVMQALMQKVVREGTAQRLKSQYLVETSVAAKTGTTQNQSDGWFMGFTPDLTFGVWVGGDEPAVRFRSLSLGSGGNMALPIAADFLKQAERKFEYNKYFEALPDSLKMALDCADYQESLPLDTLSRDMPLIENFAREILEIIKPKEKRKKLKEPKERKESKFRKGLRKLFGSKKKSKDN